MNTVNQEQKIDFNVDTNNLYKEESITDLKVASLRQLLPINIDGTKDESRDTIYIGHTQLISPQGPIPIQSKMVAKNLKEAIDEFPHAMQQALAKVIEEVKKQQQTQKQNESRIIVPGR